MQAAGTSDHLLAIDLGLRCGLALFGPDGRLRWYRSQHYGDAPALRRAAARQLADPRVGWLISEGDISLGAIWERVAMKQGVRVSRVSAEAWRDTLLYLRERRGSAVAKRHAGILARRVIAWSGAPAPTALRHDAAEAILIGLWGVLSLGWLRQLPTCVRQPSAPAADL